MIPTLTPLDSPIFDDDVIADLEDRGVVPCSMPSCSKPTAWHLRMRCCGASAEFCDHHGRKVLQKMRRRLARARRVGHAECVFCETSFPAGSLLDDVLVVIRR